MILSQEQQDYILESITSNNNPPIIKEPLILMDHLGDPWVIDESVIDLMYQQNAMWNIRPIVNNDKTMWDRCKRHITVIFDVGGTKEPLIISKDNDPVFIEQVKMAFQLARL